MAEGGAAKRKRVRDSARAAYMKANGINRDYQRCPVCYRIVGRENGAGSRYNHICKG
jgi:hypothetical protein